MAVHITGTMGMPSGAVYPNCEMYFERKVGVVSQGGHAVVPEKTIVKSNASALVDFYLLYGEYIGTIQTTLGVVKFAFSVLDVASATFTSCIGDVSVPIPASSVADAQASAAAALVSASQAALYDGIWFDDLPSVTADTVLSYTAGAGKTLVAPGDYVQTRNGFTYTVAASGATDQHITTAGAVKLYVAKSFTGIDASMFPSTDLVALKKLLTVTGGSNVDVNISADGQAPYVSNVSLTGANGSIIRPTAKSTTGTFITNRNPAIDPDVTDISAKNVEFNGVIIDGDQYPAAVFFATTAATSTTVTLPSGASAVDGYYNGYNVQAITGTAAGQTKVISAYVGATRTATVSVAFSPAPTAGDPVAIGWNDNAIAAIGGSKRVRVIDSKFSNFEQGKFVNFSAGGKGVNFESGVTDSYIDGCTFENCFTGAFFQGVNETFGTGVLRSTVACRLLNSHMENCGSAFTFAGINSAELPLGDPNVQMVYASGVSYHNCGFAPMRVVSTDKQKSGIINLLEANNVLIENVQGYNDATYPATTPGWGVASYSTMVGNGLSGNVGALIWGHGRNIRIDNVRHWGALDRAVQVQRGRALGDDASGGVRNCSNWNLTNIEIFGAVQVVLGVDAVSTNVPEAEFTGSIQVTVDTATSAIVSTNMTAYDLITLDVTERNTGKRVIGTPQQIIRAGNSFSSFGAGISDLRGAGSSITLMADDTIYTFNPPKRSGFMTVEYAPNASPGGTMFGLVYYSTFGTAVCALAGTVALVAVGTGALTNGSGDGVDGSINISVAAGASNGVTIKNRLGPTARSIMVRFLP